MKLNQSLLFTCPHCRGELLRLWDYRPKENLIAEYYQCESCGKKWVYSRSQMGLWNDYSKLEGLKVVVSVAYVIVSFLLFCFFTPLGLIPQTFTLTTKIIVLIIGMLLIWKIIIPLFKKDLVIKQTKLIELTSENIAKNPQIDYRQIDLEQHRKIVSIIGALMVAIVLLFLYLTQ